MKVLEQKRSAAIAARRIDGRWISVGIITGFLIAIYIEGNRTDFVTAWARVGVEHLRPCFRDARFLTTLLETYRAGVDPFVSNSFDPSVPLMNYPRVWLALSYLGLGEKNTAALAIALAAAFYTAVALLVGRTTITQGFIYGVLLCSPPAMLAVERGNIDVLIFTLLVIAALVFKHKSGVYTYFLLTLAAILKLYPVCGFAVGLQERRYRGLVLFGLGLAAFALYVCWIRTDIGLMLAHTPQVKEISYGRRVLFQEWKFGADVEPWSRITVIGCVMVAVIASASMKHLEFSSRAGSLMTIGAAVYGGTFAVMNSFNYRLIFLLFVIPQLLEWAKRPGGYRWAGIGSILLIASVLGLANTSTWDWRLFTVKEILNWLVFLLCMVVLLCLGKDAWSALLSRVRSQP